jgi:hypothetical protein
MLMLPFLLAMIAAAQTAPFDAIALSGGGEVIVRQGPVHEVRLVAGDARYTRVAVEAGRLSIEHCRHGCPRFYRLTAEVTAPRVSALSVTDGGVIRVRAGFSPQATAAASVRDGGAIDMRALAAADVTASIAQGGMVFTRPGRSLEAAVQQGGRVTYWGTPIVHSAVEQGGVVVRGNAADASRPLGDLSPHLPPIPPLPRLPH